MRTDKIEDKNLMSTLDIKTQLRHALKAIEELTIENEKLSELDEWVSVEKFNEAIKLIKYFTDRVDNGTIRSRVTYAKYKEFLESLPNPPKK